MNDENPHVMSALNAEQVQAFTLPREVLEAAVVALEEKAWMDGLCVDPQADEDAATIRADLALPPTPLCKCAQFNVFNQHSAEDQAANRCSLCTLPLRKMKMTDHPKPPRCKRPDETTEDYRVAVGWDQPRQAEPLAEPPYAKSLGYSLAMRVLQSDLYPRLDPQERSECDAFIGRGQTQAEPPEQAEPMTMLTAKYAELSEVAKVAYRALCDAEAVINTIDGEDVLESINLEELQGRIEACAGNLFCLLGLPTSALYRAGHPIGDQERGAIAYQHRGISFVKTMGDPTMPPDDDRDYDEWLFNKAYKAGRASIHDASARPPAQPVTMLTEEEIALAINEAIDSRPGQWTHSNEIVQRAFAEKNGLTLAEERLHSGLFNTEELETPEAI